MKENNQFATGDEVSPFGPDVPTINQENVNDEERQESTNAYEERDEQEEGIERLLSYFDSFPGKDGIEYAPKSNIADMFSEQELLAIGQNCIDGYNADRDSMADWSKSVEDALELIRQDDESRADGPWDGSANYKTPLIIKAALQFSDRCVIEMLRKKDLAASAIIGERDENKEAVAKRVDNYMNWQLNSEMPEWRSEHKKLIYDIPYHGSIFKKTYYDPSLGRPTSSLITYPNFAVDNSVHSLERLRRFSVSFELTKNEIETRQRRGVWLDTPVQYTLSDSSVGNGNNYSSTYGSGNVSGEAESDKYTSFVEQDGYWDCDQDGLEEPYMFILHEVSNRPLRIMPNYEIKDVKIKLRDGTEISLLDALNKRIDLKGAIIVSVKRQETLTKYDFLQDPQGGFLGVGYSHILSGYCKGINAVTNQLIDAGTLSNLPGGFMAKGFRKKMGNLDFRPGEFNQTGLSAQEMKDGIMPLPFKEPSQVLFLLMQFLNSSAQELSSSADLKGALSAQAPATTTLALVADQQEASGAIIWGLHTSMTKELKKLFNINAKFTDPGQYQKITNDAEANFMADFDERLLDVMPTANAEMSSKIQRFQQAQVALSMLEPLTLANANTKPLIKFALDNIGFDAISEQVAPTATPDEQLIELFKKNPQLKAMVMGEKENAKRLTDEQIKALEEERLRVNTETIATIREKEAKASLIDRQVGEVAAKTLHIITQADREEALAKNEGATQSMLPLVNSPAFQPNAEPWPEPVITPPEPVMPEQGAAPQPDQQQPPVEEIVENAAPPAIQNAPNA